MPLLFSDICLTPDQDQSELREVLSVLAGVPATALGSIRILRRSIDARHDARILYRVEITCPDEDDLYRRCAGRPGFRVEKMEDPPPSVPLPRGRLAARPVVVGFGPAGIFAALVLARSGAEPIVLERGRAMAERVGDVAAFWSTGFFVPESNVCFGEGGAGTFSDGKLTTRIRSAWIPWLFRELAEAGAPPEILYEARPHIGTDRLRRVIVGLRKRLKRRAERCVSGAG